MRAEFPARLEIWECLQSSIGVPIPESTALGGFLIAADDRAVQKALKRLFVPLCGEIKQQVATLPTFVLGAAPGVTDKVLLLELGLTPVPRELLACMQAAIWRHQSGVHDVAVFDAICVDSARMDARAEAT